MIIDVTKLTKVIVGKQTLERIEEILESERKNGNTGVQVDVTHLALRKDFAIDVARLENEYNCKFIGLGEKESQVDAIVGTGYFIKESLGKVEYGKSFRRLVEMSDFPLMIKDNRRVGDELIIYNIIQPLSFDNMFFYYNVIKPYLLEPEELEKACWIERENIWDRESIHITDIGGTKTGFRFANTLTERTLLDIFTQIIEGTLTGFYVSDSQREDEQEDGK